MQVISSGRCCESARDGRCGFHPCAACWLPRWLGAQQHLTQAHPWFIRSIGRMAACDECGRLVVVSWNVNGLGSKSEALGGGSVAGLATRLGQGEAAAGTPCRRPPPTPKLSPSPELPGCLWQSLGRRLTSSASKKCWRWTGSRHCPTAGEQATRQLLPAWRLANGATPPQHHGTGPGPGCVCQRSRPCALCGAAPHQVRCRPSLV